MSLRLLKPKHLVAMRQRTKLGHTWDGSGRLAALCVLARR